MPGDYEQRLSERELSGLVRHLGDLAG